MCGITGIWLPRPINQSELIAQITAMSDSLAHRGPDSSGIWCDGNSTVAFGHRRLSILDLSDRGHQPMISRSNRYVLTFNGEIYNHLDLRSELEASGLVVQSSWSSSSDTETLLTAVEIWGLDEALEKIEGMFAFALWDCADRKLHIARDRVGEKPIYYGFNNGVFYFSSELKAFKTNEKIDLNIDLDALSLYFERGFVPAPFSIYKGIFKLTTGSYVTLTQSDIEIENLPLPFEFWSFDKLAHETQSTSLFKGSFQDAVAKASSLIDDSVEAQLLSDVPVGAFLSGGIDSALIVSSMARVSGNKMQTFTVGFQDRQYDESEAAQSVAKKFGAQHHTVNFTPRQLQDSLSDRTLIQDEPFADPAKIPSFLLSQFAKKEVSVVLSGDGGDELFGGYDRHVKGVYLWSKFSRTPAPIRFLVSNSLSSINQKKVDSVAKLLPRRLLPGKQFLRKIDKAAALLKTDREAELYRYLAHSKLAGLELVKGVQAKGCEREDGSSSMKLAHKIMLQDCKTYLPDNILVKLDRSSMACSLETRLPFLNTKVMNFAWSLPLGYKISGQTGKVVLRELLAERLGSGIRNRPKQGFNVPIEHWLRGPLKNWAYSYLNPNRLVREGYLDSEIVTDIWLAHQSGSRNYGYELWVILMFQLWLESEYSNQSCLK